jgi:beta-galactosidase
VFCAGLPVVVEVTGAAELAALDTSDPRDVTPVHAGRRNAYQGRVLALVQAGSAPGMVAVRASAEGLPVAELQLTVR